MVSLHQIKICVFQLAVELVSNIWAVFVLTKVTVRQDQTVHVVFLTNIRLRCFGGAKQPSHTRAIETQCRRSVAAMTFFMCVAGP